MRKISVSDVPLLLQLGERNNSLVANVCAHVMLNLGLSVVSIVTLFCTKKESPNTLIRLWIFTDALLSIFAVILSVDYELVVRNHDDSSRIVKLCGSLNSTVYFVWWMLGVHWAAPAYGGDNIFGDAPRLYWWATILVSMPACSLVRSFISVLTATFLDAFLSAGLGGAML